MKISMFVLSLALSGGVAASNASAPADFSWSNVNYPRGDADVGGWAETSRVTNVTVSGNRICVYHSKARDWKKTKLGEPGEQIDIEGNIWVVAKVGNRWHAATWDWLRPGQQCKAEHMGSLGDEQIRAHPLDHTWRPRPGEVVGFFMSGRARDNVRGSLERSNIGWYRLGQGMVGSTGGSGGRPGKVLGRCSPTWKGMSDDSCLEGTFHGHPGPDFDAGLFRWTCRSIPHEGRGLDREAPCKANQTTQNDTNDRLGKCGAWAGESNASCAAGKYHSHPRDTGEKVLWTCQSVPRFEGDHSLGEVPCEALWSSVGQDGCPNNGYFKWKNGKCLASCGHQANLFLKHCRESGAGGCADYRVSSGGGCSSPPAGLRKTHDLEAHDVGTCCLLGPAVASNPSNNQDNAGDENRDVSSEDDGGGNQPQCYPGGEDHGDADCQWR